MRKVKVIQSETELAAPLEESTAELRWEMYTFISLSLSLLFFPPLPSLGSFDEEFFNVRPCGALSVCPEAGREDETSQEEERSENKWVVSC